MKTHIITVTLTVESDEPDIDEVREAVCSVLCNQEHEYECEFDDRTANVEFTFLAATSDDVTVTSGALLAGA